MREVVIAMADITQGDTHLLQHRTHDPNKPAANLIGFFGGQLEEDETSVAALCREIREETSLDLDQSEPVLIGPFETTMEHGDDTLHISGKVYHVKVPPGYMIEAKEGQVVRIHHDELASRIADLSPATKQVVKQYYLKEN